MTNGFQNSSASTRAAI